MYLRAKFQENESTFGPDSFWRWLSLSLGIYIESECLLIFWCNRVVGRRSEGELWGDSELVVG